MNFKPQLRFPEFSGEWEEKKLGEVSFLNPKSDSLPDKFIYIDLDSVESGLLKKKKVIFKNDAPSRAQRVLENFDILYQTVRPYQKNNYFFSLKDSEKYVASTGYAQIRAKDDSKFLYYAMHTERFVNEVLANCTGTSYPAINSKDLGKIKLRITSVMEQEKIASFLSKVDSKIDLLEKKQELWETYKKGIMQQIFSQKLRFKDENGEDYPDWEEKKFETIINYGKAGGTPTSTNKNYYGGQIPFLSISDMTSQGKYIKSTEKLITKAGLNNSSAWIVPENSLLYSIYASVGSVAINKSDISTSQAIFGIILDENIVEIEYIYYYLLDYKKYIHKFIETGTQGNLNAKTVRNLVIKVPSQNEQTKISNYLSFIDIKIEQLSKEVKINKKFKKGLLQQMFC